MLYRVFLIYILFLYGCILFSLLDNTLPLSSMAAFCFTASGTRVGKIVAFVHGEFFFFEDFRINVLELGRKGLGGVLVKVHQVEICD